MKPKPIDSSSFEAVRSQEYGVLREELKINRQFVFERPLLIVGVSFAAIANLEGELLLQAASLFFLLLLFYNLWFTFNRLNSNSRILGYLRVAHESSDPRNRPGWESALSLHRRWLAENRKTYREIVDHCERLDIHDTNRFFQGIYWFHIMVGGLAVFVALNSLVGTTAGLPTLALSALTVMTYVTGIVLSLTRWNPYKIKNPIEVETLVWEEVLVMEAKPQLTLVAFYGEKEGRLGELIKELQHCLTERFGSRFTAYEPEQVHATIIGLEGVRVGDHVVNSNFVQMRREVRVLDFPRLFSTLREHLPIEVQLGGFTHGQAYPFQSQGLHPYLRSFAIRGPVAVAMGWPSSAGAFPQSLDSLRRSLNDAGVLHKYHGTPSDVDNDLFLVVGRVEEITESERELANSFVRDLLANRDPLHVLLNETHLSVVAYKDQQLRWSSSEQISIKTAASHVSSLVDKYPEVAV